MHKAFPLPVIEFPPPVKKVATARRKEKPLLAAPTGIASDETGKKKGRTVTVTADDMQKRKNDVKARTTLLLSLPDEHQLRFNVEIKQDDLNQMFLTSLAPEWLMHTIVWRNMSDLDTMSLDDLYNHLKDINQIDEDGIEEMDIKWNMALLSMRADKFWKKTGKKISIQGTDMTGQGSKVEEQAPKALMAIDGVGWDWSYMANDEENHALVAEKEAPIQFSLMANTSAESKVFDNSLCSKDYQVLATLHNDLKISKSSSVPLCEVCHRAKQTRKPFPLSVHKSKNLGDLVHLNLWGPYRVTSREGYKYFLTIVDDLSRAVWVYLVKTKNEDSGVTHGVRRSGRPTKMLARFNSNAKYGIEKYVKYSCLRRSNLCFATTLNKSVEPTSYYEALKDNN
nr:ribonuclease H-like domain-containing protein [Tanacetum cinerariifolium]